VAIRTGIEYPEDAETRGKIRAWKKVLAKRYVDFESGYQRLSRGSLKDYPVDFYRRGSKLGRRRAFEGIAHAIGAGATLSEVDFSKRASYAIFSILKPRDRVLLEGRESWQQDCVTVNYFAAGYIGEYVGVAEGLWTFEIPDHALGRAVWRSGYLHPEKIIMEAHANLLKLPDALVNSETFRDLDGRGILIKAGKGAFVAHLHIGPDVSDDLRMMAHVRAPTWLDEDMLGEEQIPLFEPGSPGRQLGDNIFLPRPYRRVEPSSDGLVVSVAATLLRRRKERRESESERERGPGAGSPPLDSTLGI